MSRFVVVAAVLVAIGGSLFGYDAGVISGAILFIRQEFALDTTGVELVVSSAVVAATIGAIASGRLIDSFGRRPVLLVAAVTFSAGALLSAIAPNVASLIGARLLIGAAIGVTSLAVPLYISELAPPRREGGWSRSISSP